MSTISFSVDAKIKQEIDQAARQEGQSKSDLFRELWKQYRFNRTYEYFQGLSRRRALELGIQSDEDVERVFG